MSNDLDLFAIANAERDAAIARADKSVRDNPDATELVQRVTARLLALLHEQGRQEFTADEIGALLDSLSVSTDLTTRRRLVGTIINRNSGKLWKKIGWATSARRHSSPIALWKLI